MLDCCLLIETVYFMKLKEKMFINILIKILNKDLFDFSEYSLNSKFFDPVKKSYS